MNFSGASLQILLISVQLAILTNAVFRIERLLKEKL